MRSIEQLPALSTHEALTDIGTVAIDNDLPYEQRVMQFLAQIQDPYHFTCGNTRVSIEYSNSGRTIENGICAYIQKKLR